MCSHGCTCVHMVLLTCKHIPEGVMHNIDIKVFQSSHKNPSPNWVNKCVRMKAKRCKDASLFRKVENGMITMPLECGPPKKLIGKFVERPKTQHTNLPIPATMAVRQQLEHTPIGKKRHARHYN